MKVIKHKDKWYLQSETGYKEILLSTDQDLIKDGVQEISEEFFQWFFKNPSCEEVEVESNYRVKSGTIQEHNEGKAGYEYYDYKIIIPSREPKKDVNWKSDIINKIWDEDEEPKPNIIIVGDTNLKELYIKNNPERVTVIEDRVNNFLKQLPPKQDWFCPNCDSYVSSESVTFEETHQICNRRVILRETKQGNFYDDLLKYFETTPREKVLEDWNKSAHLDNVGPTVDEFLENTNKQQETPEEAAKSKFPHKPLVKVEITNKKREAFIEGANWMQERMYSDMQEYAKFCIECDRKQMPLLLVQDWYEQNK